MARPIIALLSDFGTRDPYVAAMKGVVLAICPEVTLVDLTHDVPAHDVRAGARVLAECCGFYPPGTIFVAVVDPGVGSARRALAVDGGDRTFIGPDNGVLGDALVRHPPTQIVELTAPAYQRPTVSRTFEGRDRFAPAAAWLARGTALVDLGRAVQGFALLPRATARVDATSIDGEVVAVDRFGNLISNIDRHTAAAVMRDGDVDIALGPHAVPRLVATYADAAAGAVVALFGSTDHLEIAVNGASAAAHFGAAPGTAISVRRREPV